MPSDTGLVLPSCGWLRSICSELHQDSSHAFSATSSRRTYDWREVHRRGVRVECPGTGASRRGSPLRKFIKNRGGGKAGFKDIAVCSRTIFMLVCDCLVCSCAESFQRFLTTCSDCLTPHSIMYYLGILIYIQSIIFHCRASCNFKRRRRRAAASINCYYRNVTFSGNCHMCPKVISTYLLRTLCSKLSEFVTISQESSGCH